MKFKKPIIYAPLAGCSDYPFRSVAARYKPGLMFCEMVKMEPLLMHKAPTMEMLRYAEEMRPIGAQICGSDPKLAGPAASFIEELGFDCVDLNCGCPVDKVTKKGDGSGMLKDVEKIGEVISNMVAAVSIPVSVKVRAGWDEENIVVEEVTRIAEEAGAEVIYVHGRTRKQAYNGPANWEYIKRAKRVAKHIKVVGNGDVFSADAALRMFEETLCDAVLVSRGTMGQPWIVEEIERAMRGEVPFERTPDERREALLEHLALSKRFKSERGALIDMRRVCSWYLRDAPGAREIRSRAAKGASLDEIREIVASFSFQSRSQPC